ncbi:hypothetical protein IMSAGC012_00579 [Lachnospiraceae bacterium]|jgi:hypothetical protein|nr:DUF4474 domain-containing protein [Eubacterium sp.]GFI25470.1 hypothetical protein IMSAGC012_00579 [Lachnospiraceae bacterium]
MEIAGVFVGIFFVLLVIWLIWRREMCKRKVMRMSEKEKAERLNELTVPFGFAYERKQDIFVSEVDAWQRKEGYEELFDRLASKFNMIIDCVPVYFDYKNKTWLIEFWKGQYGINTGAEVGVYHANRPIPKNQRRKVHYNAVSDEEMPLIGMCLKRKTEHLFSRKEYHWWLAAFRMGMASQPKDLTLYASITFGSCAAAEAFEQGLMEAGLSGRYRVRGRKVTVLLDQTSHPKGKERLYRAFVQKLNRFYCSLYRAATRPFTKTADRMMFLYEQLPWCFRRMLRLHAYGRKVRIKK